MNDPRTVSWLDRASAKLASAITFPAAAALGALGLRRPPDPWRRTLGVGLRSEASKFVLSAFGLRLPDPPNPPVDLAGVSEIETQLLLAFARFLDDEPDARCALARAAYCDERVRTDHVDVALGQFTPAGKLAGLTFWLDPRRPPTVAPTESKEIETAAIRAYNHTHLQAEVERGARTLEHLDGTGEHGRRIMSSCLLSVEGDPDSFFEKDRFAPPDFRVRRSLALGVMNVVFRRIARTEVDCWLQVHHVGADGAPMQELLTRLERAWSPTLPVAFPAEPAARVVPVSAHGERELWLGHDFIDFQPLFDLHARLGDVSIAALLLWQLAKEPEFADARFALAVDVPARDGADRAVDLISIRPADFAARFADYVREFRALVAAARERRSPTWQAMTRIAQLPPRLARAMVRTHPDLSAQTFGTVGLSILRDAKLFLAPMSDLAFDGGFLAIGNFMLPTRGDTRVACVSTKGTAEQAERLPAALRRMIAACAREENSLYVQVAG